ncbi:methyl-accepting chemotaxis protein [Roseateles paludis]|jgi:methyl-accepting chemotaxis protein|uniref:Methyl-accepting chemotaxis protein n=1 Tax=Roseateles paludis TaxID=3145238 RepID=A0ABV0G4L2_9BURK
MTAQDAFSMCTMVALASTGLCSFRLWLRQREAVFSQFAWVCLLAAGFYAMDGLTRPVGERPNLWAAAIGMSLSVAMLHASAGSILILGPNGRPDRQMQVRLQRATLWLHIALLAVWLALTVGLEFNRRSFFWGYSVGFLSQIGLLLVMIGWRELVRSWLLLLALLAVPVMQCVVVLGGAELYALRYLLGMAAALLTMATLVQRVLDLQSRSDADVRALEAAQERLHAVLAAMLEGSDSVAESGERMSVGAQQLAIRTDQQTGSLQAIAGNVDRAVAQVLVTADRISAVDGQCARLREQAFTGTEQVQTAAQTIELIGQRSAEMQEAVSLIESIAFQTNILALNAAIEAARAGAAGRGFAVVASEVRSLSGRTSEAARRVRDLIARAGSQIEGGIAQVQGVREQLSAMLGVVQDVADNTQQLSGDARTQSGELSRMLDDLRALLNLTQDNAALVAESVMTADGMNQSAAALRALVSDLSTSGAESAPPAAAGPSTSPSPRPSPSPAPAAEPAGVEFF